MEATARRPVQSRVRGWQSLAASQSLLPLPLGVQIARQEPSEPFCLRFVEARIKVSPQVAIAVTPVQEGLYALACSPLTLAAHGSVEYCHFVRNGPGVRFGVMCLSAGIIVCLTAVAFVFLNLLTLVLGRVPSCCAAPLPTVPNCS